MFVQLEPSLLKDSAMAGVMPYKPMLKTQAEARIETFMGFSTRLMCRLIALFRADSQIPSAALKIRQHRPTIWFSVGEKDRSDHRNRVGIERSWPNPDD